jgi:hypothetical protein
MFRFGSDTFKNRCIKQSEKLLVWGITNGWMENSKQKPIGLWPNLVRSWQSLPKLSGPSTLNKASFKMLKPANK